MPTPSRITRRWTSAASTSSARLMGTSTAIRFPLPSVPTETTTPTPSVAIAITGDFRARSYGPHDAALHEMARVRPHIKTAMYGVLGNHDFVEMVPDLEALGINMLINESAVIRLNGDVIYIAGIDDRDAAAVMRACDVDLDLLREKLTGYIDNELSGLVLDPDDAPDLPAIGVPRRDVWTVHDAVDGQVFSRQAECIGVAGDFVVISKRQPDGQAFQ